MFKISLVGASNVGKSSLFNSLVGTDLSIVHESENTTNDYLSCNLESSIFGRITLTDTIGFKKQEDFDTACGKFILNSDLILHVIAGSSITSLDEQIFNKTKHLRRWVIINKCDKDIEQEDFYKKIPGEKYFFTQAKANRLEELSRVLGLKKYHMEHDLIGIIGRCNSGKSTLLNSFLEQERSKVSHIAGTTRDTVEELLVDHILGHLRLLDTAGYRQPPKNSAKKNNSLAQMEQALHLDDFIIKQRKKSLMECKGIILVLDNEIGFSHLDKDLLEEAQKYGHYLIIVINKIDKPYDYGNLKLNIEKNLHHSFKSMKIPKWIPLIPISAKLHELGNLKRTILNVKNQNRQFSTSALNKWIRNLNFEKLKIKYITQIKDKRGIYLRCFGNILKEQECKFLASKFAENFNIKGFHILINSIA